MDKSRPKSSDPRGTNTAPRKSIAYTRASVIGLPGSRVAPGGGRASTASTLRQPAGAAALSAPRSLAEELEKVEQSITLTLQEIDQNFSMSHRIITASILPIVEQYALQSHKVWESSKFWKEFFESSANVSLAGYEELNTELDINETEPSHATEYSATMDYDYSHAVPQQTPEVAKPSEQNRSLGPVDGDEDSSFAPFQYPPRPRQANNGAYSRLAFDDDDDLETERNITGTAQFIKTLNLDDQSTPRVILGDRADLINEMDKEQNSRSSMQWADMVSPFEEMKSDLKTRPASFDISSSISLPQVRATYDRDDGSPLPQLPRKLAEPRTPGRDRGYRRPDNSTIDEESGTIIGTPESSPFSPFEGTSRPRAYGGQQSVLLHRVLNKTWGIQATPKPSPSKRPQLPREKQGMTTPKNVPSFAARFSSSPLDSPPVTHINSTIFSSPERD